MTSRRLSRWRRLVCQVLGHRPAHVTPTHHGHCLRCDDCVWGVTPRGCGQLLKPANLPRLIGRMLEFHTASRYYGPHGISGVLERDALALFQRLGRVDPSVRDGVSVVKFVLAIHG